MKIHAIGGYNEVGKNMTCIEAGGEAVILDMGIHLENYIKYTEDEDILNINSEELVDAGAIPDISGIRHLNVKGIIPTHAHLDHLGAIPFQSGNFDAEILGTPFTTAVLNSTLVNEKIKLKNKIKTLTCHSIYPLSNNMKVEFINVTHSTPQTAMVAVHTKEGIILYANDFKFDLYPTFGKKPDFERLGELGKKGVKALIVDSTYAEYAMKMPSESVAKQMLKDVMLGTNSKGKAMVVTTFSSHIARLNSIIEFGRKMGRRIVFLGRSLDKYTYAAESIGLVNFSKEVEIVRYSKKIKRKLKHIQRDGVHKYLLVVTGHQGEPKSTLAKMVDNKMDFKFRSEDHVIFSCKTIPTPTNIANRDYIERVLAEGGVRIFKDIHQSGHAAREDLRDLINLVKPEHIIPAHGTRKMTVAMKVLAEEMGYKADKSVHLMNNGSYIRL